MVPRVFVNQTHEPVGSIAKTERGCRDHRKCPHERSRDTPSARKARSPWRAELGREPPPRRWRWRELSRHQGLGPNRNSSPVDGIPAGKPAPSPTKGVVHRGSTRVSLTDSTVGPRSVCCIHGNSPRILGAGYAKCPHRPFRAREEHVKPLHHGRCSVFVGEKGKLAFRSTCAFPVTRDDIEPFREEAPMSILPTPLPVWTRNRKHAMAVDPGVPWPR